MAFDKVPFAVALLLIIGACEALGSDEDWPAEISPLDTLSFWNDLETPVAVEEAPRPCCLPRTLTATLFTEIRNEGRRDEDRKPKPRPKPRTQRFMEVVYIDQNGQRIAEDVTIARRRNATTVSYIILYSKTANSSIATVYAFSKAIRKCVKQVVQGATFPPTCLPANSTFFGSFSLGGALNAQSWGYFARDRRTAIAASVILAPANCIPILVGERIYSRQGMTYEDDPEKKKKGPRITNVGTLYTNVSPTIRDPSVFTPPSYCNRTDDTLTFDEDFDLTTIIDRYVRVP